MTSSPPDLSLSRLALSEEPTNSVASRLPPELLLKIFRLALDSSTDNSERFVTKLLCAQVCRSWWIASEVGIEYVVDNSLKAMRLATLATVNLRFGGRGHYVRALDLSLHSRGQARSRKLAALIRECCNVKVLRYTMLRTHGESSDYLGQMGDVFGSGVRSPLVDALAKLDLAVFELNAKYHWVDLNIQMHPTTVSPQKIPLQCWQTLKTLVIEDAILRNDDKIHLHPQAALVTVIWHATLAYPILAAINCTPSSSSIRTLLLGSPSDDVLFGFIKALASLLPNLSELELLDGAWIRQKYVNVNRVRMEQLSELQDAFASMSCMERLTLGPKVASPAVVATQLCSLPRLRTLSIIEGKGTVPNSNSGLTSFDVISSTAMLDHLQGPKSLVLSKWLLQGRWCWPEEDLTRFMDRAEEKGVVVSFA